MRELKFRAWAHASRAMFYPSSDGGWSLFNGVLQALPNTTVMQYTGMKDRNGKEIYEGDVVRALVGRRLHGVYQVKYLDHCFIMCEHDAESSLDGIWFNDVEVIGNVYESPELLQGMAVKGSPPKPE